jgi:hypothetical protein
MGRHHDPCRSADADNFGRSGGIRAGTKQGSDGRRPGAGQEPWRPHGPQAQADPHQQEEVRKRKAEGQSVRELGRSYNASPNTISRIK